jgi:hypothetical protein
MHRCYDDILSRITRPPRWFDEHAVPRFEAFVPHDIADIYADECCLLLIACQNCGHHFEVAMSSSTHDRIREAAIRAGLAGEKMPSEIPDATLAQAVTSKSIGYGDPPNVGCCPAGPTMSSDSVCVLQYWSRRSGSREWKRDETLEVVLETEWIGPPPDEVGEDGNPR